MKYILMMNGTKADWTGTPNGRKRTSRRMLLSCGLSARNSRIRACLFRPRAWAWPDQAKIVRAGADGTPITDGVFPESKEFLAGYWIVDVESPEQAYKIAARASAAPGPGGKPGKHAHRGAAGYERLFRPGALIPMNICKKGL